MGDQFNDPADEVGDPEAAPLQTDSMSTNRLPSLSQSARRNSLRVATYILVILGTGHIILSVATLSYSLSVADSEIRTPTGDQEQNTDQPAASKLEQDPQQNIKTEVFVLSGKAILGTVLVGLGFAVRSFPVPATILGLALYIGSIAVFAGLDPVGLLSPWIVIQIIITVCLFASVQSAVVYQKRQRESDQGRIPGGAGGIQHARLPEVPSAEARRFQYVMLAFGLILASSVGLTVFRLLTRNIVVASEQVQLIQIALLEVIDVIVILVALLLTRQAVSTTPVRHGLGFLLLVPMLALAMGINFGYHAVLNDFLELEEAEAFAPSKGLLVWWAIVICVQPAIFEELFFRGVAFRSFHRIMGGHGTVLVTSVMFGVAHIYSPLSIPVLITLGIILGYVRLWSGSLVVPILMHLIHNAVLLGLQLQA